MSDLRETLTFLRGPQYKRALASEVFDNPRLTGYVFVYNGPPPMTFDGVVNLKSRDGGQALEATIGDDDTFAVLRSWDENKRHSTLTQFDGRRVRVTVEIVE